MPAGTMRPPAWRMCSASLSENRPTPVGGYKNIVSTGFGIMVRELVVRPGAGFIVALTGTMMTMPGLPQAPAAEVMDVDADGRIRGLF